MGKRSFLENMSPEDASDSLDALSESLAKADVPIGEMGDLRGCTRAMSDMIRNCVAMEYRGYSNPEISIAYGKSERYVEHLKNQNQKAFYQAKSEHIARVVHDYGKNMQMCAVALSNAGLVAARTLVEVMQDPNSPPKVRVDAADKVLNTLSWQRKTNRDVTKNVQNSVVMEIQNVMSSVSDIVKANNGRVIDVGEEEVDA